MGNVNFLTPLEYGENTTWKQWVEEQVDGYFYLGGRVANVSPNSQKVAFVEGITTPLWKTALKVVSYVTLVLPALMLTIKFAFRLTHPNFYVVKKIRSGVVIERGLFRNEKLIQGIRNIENENIIVGAKPFCDLFDTPEEDYLTFVELEQHGVERFIPAIPTDKPGEYRPFENSVYLKDVEAATYRALEAIVALPNLGRCPAVLVKMGVVRIAKFSREEDVIAILAHPRCQISEDRRDNILRLLALRMAS